MKKFIKFLIGVLIGLGLIQLTDGVFYLMNQPDTYAFNLGLVGMALIIIAFVYLGLYLIKTFKSEEVKQEKEE
jgi:hypothetical protein